MVTATKNHQSGNKPIYSLRKLEEINKKIFSINIGLINNDTSSNIKNLSNEQSLHFETESNELVCISYHADEENYDKKEEG